ncbi:hypothetical protein [Enterococcus xiangfangensis]|uniref:hypothetical protein n=1 Tax=Enterococcus xiangfangensis TaxID=1296537 RepID=UPI0010F98D1C|nr:hypothetical protein [Enterococcus xiangfangensis]MBM7712855.1 hypothetical protein [Enterococcus xiangfangensis]
MKKIPIMVDTVRITSKPTKRNTEGSNGIWGRCLRKENYQEVSEEELLEILGTGKSFIPCKTKGFTNSKESLLETHLVILDIDNTELNEEGKPVPLSKDDPRYLSIEKAIGLPIVKDEAFAVQKSIRHSEESERFRLVFLLKAPVTNWKENKKLYMYLQKQIPYCDEQVSLSTRIFYGGKSDENAVISIGNIFDNGALLIDDLEEIVEETSVILPDSMKSSTDDFTEMIKRGDSQEMKEWFGDSIFSSADMTINEIYDRLLKTDMKKLLNIKSEKFCCLFHDDRHPSGAIYKGDNDHSYYHCFSESCGVKGDFLSIVKGVRGLDSRGETFNWFLMKLELYPSEYQSIIEQMPIGFDTLDALKPTLHKAIRGKVSDMKEIYETLIPRVYFSTDKQGNTISIMSGSLLAELMDQRYGRKTNIEYSIGKWNKLLSFMTFIGMVDKLDDNDLSIDVVTYLDQIAEHTKEKNGYFSYKGKAFEPKRVNVYRLRKLDASFFDRLINEIIPVMENFYFTYQHFSYAWVKLCFGEAEAKKVFPQNERIDLSNKKKRILEKADMILENLHPLTVCAIAEKELIKEVGKSFPGYSSVSVQNVLKENRGYFVKSGHYLFRSIMETNDNLNLEIPKNSLVYSVMPPDVPKSYRDT